MLEQLAAFEGVKVTKPDRTFYCLADFIHFEKDSTKLCEFLLEKVLVVTVPGIEFGLEGYLRQSYGGSVNDVTEGVARIRWALDPGAPKEIRIGDQTVVRDWT
ncbi:MAG: aminotransferase class I/II-fold pyridoxal phosphate-dependent enzyme [bacterium]